MAGGRQKKIPRFGEPGWNKLCKEIAEEIDKTGNINKVANNYNVKVTTLERAMRDDWHIWGFYKYSKVLSSKSLSSMSNVEKGEQLEILTSLVANHVIIESGEKNRYKVNDDFLKQHAGEEKKGVDIVILENGSNKPHIFIECKNWKEYPTITYTGVIDKEVFDRFKNSEERYGKARHKVVVWGIRPKLTQHSERRIKRECVEISLGELISFVDALLNEKNRHYISLVEKLSKLV